VQRGFAGAQGKSAAAKKLVLIADVCLCEYTSHGHCGIGGENGDGYEVENDASVDIAGTDGGESGAAGADIVAPSDMMDGRVADSRSLDEVEHEHTPILSYASKFASAFYGPFREAADSAPQFGDRRKLPDGWRECARGDARD
jgi:porphobilinogen synthase